MILILMFPDIEIKIIIINALQKTDDLIREMKSITRKQQKLFI